MLLDDLVGVIETLQGRIVTHGPSLRTSETRTRMALIDPLLNALGWDTSDPELVTPEYDVSGRKADYALLGDNGSPSATVEAKKLGEPLSLHRMQMLNYSNASGVEYAGLTDGDLWELYEVFKRGQLEERRILDVSIANTPTQEAALKLLLLWRPNLASGQPMAANTPVLVEATAPLPGPASVPMEFPDDTNPALTLPSDTQSRGWNPLSSVYAGKGNSSPTAIRFPGGEQRAVKNWRSVLVEVAEWLVRNRRLTAADCPIDAGKGWLFINSVPHKPNGRNFFDPREISGGIYLETNLSASDSIRFSKQLVARFGVNLETVELRFE